MDLSVGGKRPRPRVALVGAFGLADLKIFRRMFPTIWQAASIQEMVGRVDKREVDLLVIGTDFDILSGDAKITYNLTDEWFSNCHVIYFSENILVFPGPVEGSSILASGKAQGEEFILPELPLPLDRCRTADFSKLESVRGWLRLSLHFNPPVAYHAREMGKIKKIFERGTIVAERITGSTLAVTFQRKENKLGAAWLPNNIYSQSKWVDVLVSKWAETDIKRFPNFADWTSSPEWMTLQELKIVGEIETLKETKKNLIDQLDKKIAVSQSRLILVSNEIDKSRRRLITAQNEDLLDEVMGVLSEIGFQVEVVDKLIKENQPKREDLRLTDPSAPNKDWEAIVEVRAYSRSSGKTNDFQRLYRFTELYRQEKGHLPHKQIYIVNGQLELSPSQRQEPLSSSTEDLRLFAESNGLVIWTLDLFGALKFYSSDKYFAIKNSIMTSIGRWDWRIQAAEI